MAPFYLLSLSGVSIFDQLQIEEALIRADSRNWIIFNSGSTPAIVMGISGRLDQLVCSHEMSKNPIPIVRRFSGGGTVVVDEHTLFYTLIGNRSILDFPCCPVEIMRWTEKIYQPAFEGINFALRENDYTIADRKFGGNAQYITKDRWLHHSSFLWNYNQNLMDYLLMPPKMPSYRKVRSHANFLCRLSDHFTSPDGFQVRMKEALSKQFEIIPTSLASIKDLFLRPYRRATRFEQFSEEKIYGNQQHRLSEWPRHSR